MNKWDKFGLFCLLVVILLGLLTSCKTKYVAVPEWHTEYVITKDTSFIRDSVYEKDSIYMYMVGDTVWKVREKILYRDRYRDKMVYRDSIKVDSVRVPYPVEKKLSRIDRLRMFGSDAGITVIIIALVLAVIYICKWLRARSHVS